MAYKASKYSAERFAIVSRAIRRYLSPEMIANRWSLEAGGETLSTSTIYRWFEWDWYQGGDLFHYLQRAYRPYRRRYGASDRRYQLGDRRSIHNRDAVVERRERLGDWEGDTMYGKNGHLVTLVDRCSRLFKARKVPIRTKKVTAASVVSMLKDEKLHTITVDNGVEFADHQSIERKTGSRVYFADTYASWQRGSNENANGRLRRYLPRSTDLSTVSHQKLRRLVERLNNQPRKCLQWLTPNEVHYNQRVALIV